MKKLTALLLLFPVLASGEPQGWMKKADPNELYLLNYLGAACPHELDDLTSANRGVLTRSRIRTADVKEPKIGNENGIGLLVRLECYPTEISGSYIFSTSVEFISRTVETNGWDIPVRFLYGSDYITIGIETQPEIMDAVKRNVEDAITDYIEANFDLGGDDE